MKLLDTSITYVVGGRIEKCHLRLYENGRRTAAVISDMPWHDVHQIHDDATSLWDTITRQWSIPPERYSQIIHFVATSEADTAERFYLFFLGVPVRPARLVAMDRMQLQDIIGEPWETSTAVDGCNKTPRSLL